MSKSELKPTIFPLETAKPFRCFLEPYLMYTSVGNSLREALSSGHKKKFDALISLTIACLLV